MKVLKNIFNTIINVLIIAVLIISIIVAALALTSKSSGISTVFGHTIQVIVSDSMAGGSDEFEGGDFARGDVIIGKATKFDSNQTYEVGDIITYKGELDGYEDMGEQLICHRIVAVAEKDGFTVYQTQGDNRSLCQVPDQDEVDEFVYPYDIGAVFHTDDYDGIKLEGVGEFYEFIRSQLGFFLCILLPMIFFFLYVLIKVVINYVEYKKAKEEEEKEKNAPAEQTQAPQMSAEEYEEFKKFQEMKNQQNVNVSQTDEKPSEEA